MGNGRGRLTTFAFNLAGVVLVVLSAAAPAERPPAIGIPERLSDPEFFALLTRLSERTVEGKFASDNLLSNEILFSELLPRLGRQVEHGGAYLGVGPEQNFTYAANLDPQIAFVIDIRRLNLQLHLMYKALFELSTDRADFLASLFSRTRPDGLSSTSSATLLFNAFETARPVDPADLDANLRRVIQHLTVTHRFPLSAEDVAGVSAVYRAFHRYGPSMNPGSDVALTTAWMGKLGPTYRDLMTQADAAGVERSYLASEEHFTRVANLQRRNLLIPVEGDFAGSHALRAIGNYLSRHQAEVRLFYVSNVEVSLHRDGSWRRFCGNVASLPLNDRSMFVRVHTTSFVVNRTGVPASMAPSLAALVPIQREVHECGETFGEVSSRVQDSGDPTPERE